LTNPDITQLNATATPLRYNQTKGLIGRPNDKIALATTIMAHPDILTTYEDGLQETEEEKPQTNQEHHPSIATAKKPTPPTKGKEKIPPMERHIPNPL